MVPPFVLGELPGILKAVLFVQGQSKAPPLLHKAPRRSQGPLPKLLGSKPLTRNNSEDRGSGCRCRRRLGSRLQGWGRNSSTTHFRANDMLSNDPRPRGKRNHKRARAITVENPSRMEPFPLNELSRRIGLLLVGSEKNKRASRDIGELRRELIVLNNRAMEVTWAQCIRRGRLGRALQRDCSNRRGSRRRCFNRGARRLRSTFGFRCSLGLGLGLRARVHRGGAICKKRAQSLYQ